MRPKLDRLSTLFQAVILLIDDLLEGELADDDRAHFLEARAAVVDADNEVDNVHLGERYREMRDSARRLLAHDPKTTAEVYATGRLGSPLE